MSKLAGCAKDHSKEIDLYNKSYEDKVDRVKQMMQQARLALNDSESAPEGKTDDDKATKEDLYQKASYYYSQAKLVFFYLIPDEPE
jgi:hypothetical protein